MELNGAEAEDERHEGSNSEKVKQSYCESWVVSVQVSWSIIYILPRYFSRVGDLDAELPMMNAKPAEVNCDWVPWTNQEKLCEWICEKIKRIQS
jgi:hypothetical protein